MKRFFTYLLFAGFVASGPVSGGFFDRPVETKVTSGQDSPDIDQVQAEAYNGPKARIAVAQFTDKTGKGWWSGAIGDGMADQLVTALFNSNRFIVLERQTLGDVLAEQDLGASGRVRQQTAAPIGQIEGAELLVTGAVTEFEGAASGTAGSAGGFLGNVVGAIAGAVKSAHMAIDLRIIDTKTSRILAATSVEGKSTDVNLGGAIGGYFGSGGLGGSLSGWKNTPTEKALRACLVQAVDFIVSKTPPVYYRHGAGAVASSAPRASPASSVPQYAAGSVVRVKSSKLNARSGPGTGNPVVFSLGGNDPLLVQDQQNGWLKVKTQAGQEGWVAGWLVTADSSMSAPNFSAAAPSPTPVSQKTGQSGSDAVSRLKKLKQLHDQGLISNDEYEQKRNEILQEL